MLLVCGAWGQTVKKRWGRASAHSHIMVSGVMMFLSLPFPTLIKTFLVGHIDIDAMLRPYLYTNDHRCYGTVSVLAVVPNNVLLCSFKSASGCVVQTNCTVTSYLWMALFVSPLIYFLYTKCKQPIHNLKGFILQHLNNKSRFVKASTAFYFLCCCIGCEERHLLVEVEFWDALRSPCLSSPG